MPLAGTWITLASLDTNTTFLRNVTGKTVQMPFWGWRFTPATMKQLLKEDRIIFGKDETKIPGA